MGPMASFNNMNNPIIQVVPLSELCIIVPWTKSGIAPLSNSSFASLSSVRLFSSMVLLIVMMLIVIDSASFFYNLVRILIILTVCSAASSGACQVLAPLRIIHGACQLLAPSRIVGGPYKTTENIGRFADPFDRGLNSLDLLQAL